MRALARIAKIAKKCSVLCAVLAAAIAAVSLTGCDTNSGDNVTTPTTALAISPSTLTLTAGEISTFTFIASGGNSNYTWSVSTDSLGTITPTANGNTAVYQSTTNAGVNVIEVTDSTSGAAAATVTQK